MPFTYLSTSVSRLPSVSKTSLSIFADVGNLKEGDAEPLDGTILILGSGMIVFCVSARLLLPYASSSSGVSLHKQLPIPTNLL